jgi:hypothetical protein
VLLDIGASRSQRRKAIEISHATGVSAWACSGVAGQLVDILPACEGENEVLMGSWRQCIIARTV